MQSKIKNKSDLTDLFKSRLKNIINLNHELCQLSELIDWDKLDEVFSELFPSPTGHPATRTRLIAGLLYLKANFNVSDEVLVSTWVENPY